MLIDVLQTELLQLVEPLKKKEDRLSLPEIKRRCLREMIAKRDHVVERFVANISPASSIIAKHRMLVALAEIRLLTAELERSR